MAGLEGDSYEALDADKYFAAIKPFPRRSASRPDLVWSQAVEKAVGAPGGRAAAARPAADDADERGEGAHRPHDRARKEQLIHAIVHERDVTRLFGEGGKDVRLQVALPCYYWPAPRSRTCSRS